MIVAFLAAIGRGVREFVISLGFGTRTFFAVLGASGSLLRRFRLVSDQIHFIGNH